MRARMLPALALALAALAGPAPAQPPTPTITVEGVGKARAVPDTARLSAGVETRAATAEAALSDNAARMGQVIAALEAAAVPRRAIRTSGLSVTPVEERTPDGRRGTGEIDHYRVTNQVTVETEDLDALGGLVDALVGAGANRLGQISFSVAEPGALMAEARAEAMADARAAAEAYAGAEGLALGPVRAIREGGGNGPVPRLRGAALEAAADTPIMGGESTVTARVRVVWELVEGGD